MYANIDWRIVMKKKKTKNKIAVIWYTPWVWFSELCNDLSNEQKKAEKAIRLLLSTTIILFFISALSILTLIFIWFLIF